MLLPWLPTLISTLRADDAELASLLTREAGRIFPSRLPVLDTWVPPWRAEGALADLLGCDGIWPTPDPDPDPVGAALAVRYQDTARALEALL